MTLGLGRRVNGGVQETRRCLSFTPDGKMLAACGHTGRIRLYRAEGL